MDARDLRIGDAVLVDNHIMYISSTIEKGAIMEIEDDIVCIKSKDNKFRGDTKLETINPIQVTVELLEKLGFKEKEYRYSLNLKYDLELGDGFIQISDLSNSVGKDWYVHIDNSYHETIGGMDFQYLHELQHIIWDCLHIELNTEKL